MTGSIERLVSVLVTYGDLLAQEVQDAVNAFGDSPVTAAREMDLQQAQLDLCKELLAEALYPPPAQGWSQWRRDVLSATAEAKEAGL